MASENNLKEELKKAKKLHNKGVDGDKKAVQKAKDELLTLRQIEPNNALIEAYYGSSLALLARDAVRLLDKEEKAQEGLDSLNRAVSMDPNQKEIRLLRANVCLRLPEEYFSCSKIAIEDFTFLLNGYQRDSNYLSKDLVIDILKKLSKAYKNDGKPDEAAAVLDRLTKIKEKRKNK